MKVPAFPVYLFDVDGTLMDSAEDIIGAVDEVLLRRVGRRPAFEHTRRFIGRHLRDLFQEFKPDITPAEVDDWVAEYRGIYLERGHRKTRPFPGVADALSRLGGRKSTATTKGTPTTRAVLDQFGLLAYFDHVQGTDGFPAKPEPDVVLRSLELFGARPAECLFVGDSAADMEAGRRAGVKLCAARYGYGNIDEMARFTPDYWIDDLRELVVEPPLPSR